MSYHLHCISGCEKSAGIDGPDGLACVRCGAPFLPCTPETCPETFAVIATPDVQSERSRASAQGDSGTTNSNSPDVSGRRGR
jgi:hypothetical protein